MALPHQSRAISIEKTVYLAVTRNKNLSNLFNARYSARNNLRSSEVLEPLYVSRSPLARISNDVAMEFNRRR